MPYKNRKSSKARESARRSYYRNKDKIMQRRREYKLENLEKVKAQQKVYNKRHGFKRNVREKIRRQIDPAYRDRKLGYAREWRKRNPEKQTLSKKKSILKHQYGLTLEEYENMVRVSGGRCYICNKYKPATNCRNGLCVDHDHKTGKNRGLLCHSCNRALGLLGDNTEILEQAVKYLKEYEL